MARIPGGVYLAFHHEPEDNPALGTPADYIAAWRHYVAVYRATGVRNVRWTWIMMADSFHTGRADAFYPGDDMVQSSPLTGTTGSVSAGVTAAAT